MTNTPNSQLNSSVQTDPGAHVHHALIVEHKVSGDVRLHCACEQWRRASLHGFDGVEARYEIFREHLARERVFPIDSDGQRFPSAGDVIRLVGEHYEGLPAGHLAVLDGTVGKPESGFVAVFGYRAFRGRPHSESPSSEKVLVDCSGGPCPYVHVQDLRHTGEVTRVAFWRWKDNIYQAAHDTEYFELAVPVWEWNPSLILARGQVIPTGGLMGSDISMVIAQEERYRDGEVTDSGAEVFIERDSSDD